MQKKRHWFHNLSSVKSQYGLWDKLNLTFAKKCDILVLGIPENSPNHVCDLLIKI